MKVCGIIAEYNPFHSGHAYQIMQARKQSDCDYVIAVMSGDFVQRGAPALADKYMRARMALMEGADLVIMLPVYGSVSSAEGFARAGVATLLTTGIVDVISFGCEDVSVCSDSYLSLARELSHERPDLQSALAERLATGIPYAQARVEAVRSCYGKDFDLTLLNTPNNLLAFEYVRALAHYNADLNLIPVRRLGSYHDMKLADSNVLIKPDCSGNASATDDPGDCFPAGSTFASASACRNLILTDSAKELQMLEAARQIPSEVYQILTDYADNYSFLQEDDFSQMLHYALLSQKNSCYEAFLDCGNDLSARISNQLDAYKSFSGFCDLLKNKSVTRARIARALTHILLQLPAQMPAPLISASGTLPYLRILGFRETASPLLHQLKLSAQASLITRVPEAGRVLSAEAMLYFNQDLFASELYRSVVLQKCGRCYADDYRRRIEIV